MGKLYFQVYVVLIALLSTCGFAQWDIFTYAQNGDVGGIRYLLAQGVDVDARNEAGATALMEAAYANQYEAVALLLAAGADVNAEKDNWGSTPLELAAFQGNPELLHLLIGAGADAKNYSVLLNAARHNSDPEVIRVLVNAGAYIDFEGYAGFNLIRAIPERNEAALEVMREAFNSETLKNISPESNPDRVLVLMAQYGGPKLVEALLEAGASSKAWFYRAKAGIEKPVLELALSRETDEIARLLVDYGAADELTAGELIAEVATAGFGNWLVELLAQDPDLTTGMSKGLGCADVEYIELLLAAGAPLNGDDDGPTPPIIYVLSNCNDKNRLERLKKLLEVGVDPNAKSIHGETALMLAVRGGIRGSYPSCRKYFEADLSYVKTLLDYNADPNIRDDQGRNALMSLIPSFGYCYEDYDYSYNRNYARLKDPIVPTAHLSSFIIINYPSIETIKTLLANGAELIADNKGVTPLMDAFTNTDREEANNIAKIYLSHGANIEAKDNWGRTALMYTLVNSNFEGAKLLLENNADVSAKDNEGRTALFYTYSPEAVELLHSYGANVNAANNKGLTPIHSVFWGCFSRNSENEQWFASILQGRGTDCAETLKKLLGLGANPNARDKNGMTPLMYAMKLGVNSKAWVWGRRDLAHSYNDLIRAGADWELSDNEGKTVLLQATTISTKHPHWGSAYLVAGTNYAATDKEGNNGLMLTIQYGGLQDFHLFLDKRKGSEVSLDARNIHGETALILLGKLALKEKEEGSLTAEKVQLYSDSFTELIQLGADPTIVNNKGKTVIDYLREVGEFHDTEVYKRLLSLSTP